MKTLKAAFIVLWLILGAKCEDCARAHGVPID